MWMVISNLPTNNPQILTYLLTIYRCIYEGHFTLRDSVLHIILIGLDLKLPNRI